MLLKRFVDVFKQCKQLLDNKDLQLSSRNSKSRLKISWTRFIRESCSRIYILKRFFFARLARCQACRALLAQLVVECVEHCSLSSSSNMASIAHLPSRRAVNSRASCYMLRRRLYITLFRARLVTYAINMLLTRKRHDLSSFSIATILTSLRILRFRLL